MQPDWIRHAPRAAALYFVLLAATCLAAPRVGSNAATQASPFSCSKDDECGCALSADHCGSLPKQRKTADAPVAQGTTGGRQAPACFGPKNFVIAKCQQGKCACQDRGRAPD